MKFPNHRLLKIDEKCRLCCKIENCLDDNDINPAWLCEFFTNCSMTSGDIWYRIKGESFEENIKETYLVGGIKFFVMHTEQTTKPSTRISSKYFGQGLNLCLSTTEKEYLKFIKEEMQLEIEIENYKSRIKRLEGELEVIKNVVDSLN